MEAKQLIQNSFKKRRGANMLNETMIQLILIAICCVYIIFNTKADKNPKRGYPYSFVPFRYGWYYILYYELSKLVRFFLIDNSDNVSI